MSNLNLDLLKNGDINKSVLLNLLIYFHEYIENCRNDKITIFDILVSNKKNFYLKNTQKLFHMIIEIIFNKNKISESNGTILLDILKYLREKLLYIDDDLGNKTKRYSYRENKLNIYRKYITLTVLLIINKLSYSPIKKNTIQDKILDVLKEKFEINPSEFGLITNNNISKKKELREIISQLGGDNKKIKISNFKKRLEEMINNNNYGIINIKDYISDLYSENNTEIKNLISSKLKNYLHNNLKKEELSSNKFNYKINHYSHEETNEMSNYNIQVNKLKNYKIYNILSLNKQEVLNNNELYLKLKYIEENINQMFNLLKKNKIEYINSYSLDVFQENFKKLFIDLIKYLNQKNKQLKLDILNNIINNFIFNQNSSKSVNDILNYYKQNIYFLDKLIKEYKNYNKNKPYLNNDFKIDYIVNEDIDLKLNFIENNILKSYNYLIKEKNNKTDINNYFDKFKEYFENIKKYILNKNDNTKINILNHIIINLFITKLEKQYNNQILKAYTDNINFIIDFYDNLEKI